uniref:Reverse transcriptase domain-containing protein n=1 Tax=Acrobeloides nanus TaxID=290746 RepID=A0A914C3N3_9BILA
MYADDLAYLKPVSTGSDENELREDIQTLVNKYKEIALDLNSKKTKWMALSPGKRNHQLNLHIDGEEIERVDTFKYLGVDLDHKMCFKNHVARITTKCRQVIGALNRTVRKFAPRKVFEKLYQTTVEPIMNYAIETWYPSQVHLQTSVERVKRYAARLTTNNFTASYQDHLKTLNWKPICQLATERRATLMFKYHYGMREIPSEALARNTTRRFSARTGHELQYHLLNASSTTTLHSSANTMKRIWNAQPTTIATTRCPQAFRRLIQKQETYELLAKIVDVVRRTEIGL